MPVIDTRNIRRKPGYVGERQEMYFGQNGAWGLRESEILALYIGEYFGLIYLIIVFI